MQENVLITGASSGIGREFASCFAKNKSNLVLVARSVDKLEQVASQLRDQHGAHVTVIGCDLSAIGAVKWLVEELDRRQLAIEVLVNNAGFGELGKFAELSVDRQVNMLGLNVVALTELSRRLLPNMLQANRGGMINVASTAAFQPGPNMAVYFASKAYVLSFSEALVEELAGTNVKISCLCPGPTDTGFGELSGMSSLKMFATTKISAAEVAAAGYAGFRSGTAIVIPGWTNKAMTVVSKMMPSFITRKLMNMAMAGS